MRKIAIVTDTATDIPQDLAEELSIFLAPVHVIINGKDYRDKIDITTAEFYRLLPNLDPLPTTSGVNAGDFLEAFEKALEKAESIICLSIAGQLSVTLSSARAAKAALPEADITIIDTQTATAGEALIAIAAGKAAKEGKSKEEVISLIEELIPRVDTLFTVDTLEYFRRGGRLTATQALIGKFLGLRPILRLREGKIVPIARARSRQASIERLLEIMDGEVRGRDICAAIIHALVPEETERLKEEVLRRFNCREIYVLDDLGPTAGTHFGPGALGVGYYPIPE